MEPFLFILSLVIVFIIGVVILMIVPTIRQRQKSPRTFLKRDRQPDTQTLVVCAGDSITFGVGSADYMKMLEERLGGDGYEFVNAGIDGNLAWNVLQRLDEIIACQPDVVTLLVGTNDVNGTLNQAWENRYRQGQKIPEKPTLDWYRQNVERIVERLQNETKAQIALIEIPLLGEDLNSEMNQRVMKYNKALKVIATDRSILLLPLYERLCAILPQNHTPPPYEGKISLMLKAVLKRNILRKNWDQIAQSEGLYLLTDHIHLNDRAGRIIADLVEDFLCSEPIKLAQRSPNLV